VLLDSRPWALALGTPVLVIAGCFHFLHSCVRKRVKLLRGKDEGDNEDDQAQADTLSRA
jgi:hypothetical protein